jgi:hypothetical protein
VSPEYSDVTVTLLTSIWKNVSLDSFSTVTGEFSWTERKMPHPKEKIFEIDEHISKRFDIQKRLGKGAYGIVWKAIDRKTKDVVAVKKNIRRFSQSDGRPEDIQRNYVSAIAQEPPQHRQTAQHPQVGTEKEITAAPRTGALLFYR